MMISIKKVMVALFVDRLSNQRVVRDPNGEFWIVSFGENGWGQRRPFELTGASQLESVPGHYIYLLDLPF